MTIKLIDLIKAGAHVAQINVILWIRTKQANKKKSNVLQDHRDSSGTVMLVGG